MNSSFDNVSRETIHEIQKATQGNLGQLKAGTGKIRQLGAV